MTDGSVSRHLNRKSWPSFTFGLERGVTNTEEESVGSVRHSAKEEELSGFGQVILTCKVRLWLHLILPLTYRWIQVLRC